MKIKAVVHDAEEGEYWAEVPMLPGCVTEADTYDELLTNLHDAIEGWLVVEAERLTTDEPGREIEIAL